MFLLRISQYGSTLCLRIAMLLAPIPECKEDGRFCQVVRQSSCCPCCHAVLQRCLRLARCDGGCWRETGHAGHRDTSDAYIRMGARRHRGDCREYRYRHIQVPSSSRPSELALIARRDAASLTGKAGSRQAGRQEARQAGRRRLLSSPISYFTT
jgi:hypothetical protein